MYRVVDLGQKDRIRSNLGWFDPNDPNIIFIDTISSKS